ncbi:MAG: hypothetical protein DME08_28545 [Candidatus Rokuibacteriota bacterium]|nr:MAG: hypothetical protein DME08_28545 [Candidatus Rokubacteria bacterium]
MVAAGSCSAPGRGSRSWSATARANASFRLILEDRYEVLEAADGRQALERLRASPVDLVLLDIRLPEMDGIEVLERMKAVDDGVEVILVTAVKTVRIAVDAMKLGAFDYLTKPFDEDELLSLIRRALEKRSLEREVAFLRSELARRHDFDELVGQHPEMQKLYRLISQVARTTTTVVITGESGTGKELIARAIHRQGPRRDKPFVAVNPAALSDSLVESELFGHEKGAFTGAYQRKLGRFELAQGGTLFLDEISSLKPELHREDLYYRLNVVPVAVPPLRDRRDDVPLLVAHFVRRYTQAFNKRLEGLTPEALKALHDYPWPGNVRELQNVIERVVALVDGPVVGLNDIPLDLLLPDSRARVRDTAMLPLKQATDEFERQIVTRVLERVHWNRSEAARILGLHRNSLQLMLARWGLTGSGVDD